MFVQLERYKRKLKWGKCSCNLCHLDTTCVQVSDSANLWKVFIIFAQNEVSSCLDSRPMTLAYFFVGVSGFNKGAWVEMRVPSNIACNAQISTNYIVTLDVHQFSFGIIKRFHIKIIFLKTCMELSDYKRLIILESMKYYLYS